MFLSRNTVFVVWLIEKLVRLIRSVSKRFRIAKLRWFIRAGFEITSSERSEIAFWVTRNVTELTSETLKKVWSGEE